MKVNAVRTSQTYDNDARVTTIRLEMVDKDNERTGQVITISAPGQNSIFIPTTVPVSLEF